jgi:hypothetical protein
LRRHRTLLLWTLGIALLMTLFPPWLVQERRLADEPFGPPHADGYYIILAPPYERSGGDRPYTTMVSSLDVGRLLVQYVALALVAGVVIVARLPGVSVEAPQTGAGQGGVKPNCDTCQEIAVTEHDPLAADPSGRQGVQVHTVIGEKSVTSAHGAIAVAASAVRSRGVDIIEAEGIKPPRPERNRPECFA